MAKAELGTKRLCPKCASKFYDLKKNPAECPICHHGFDPEAPVKKRGKRKTVKVGASDAKDKVIAAQAASKKHSEVDDDVDLPEFEDLGIIEDIDDLDDMEDVAVVKKTGGTGDSEGDEDEAFIDEDEILEDDVDEDIDLDFDEDEEDDDRR